MAKATKIKVLRVVAKREGFRRAGRAFGAAPTDIPVSELSKAQVEALKGESMLMVTEAEAEVEAAE